MSDDETGNELQSTFLENMANKQRYISNDNASDVSEVERDDLLEELSDVLDESEEIMECAPNVQEQLNTNIADGEVSQQGQEKLNEVFRMHITDQPMSKEQLFKAKKQCLVEIRKLRSCGAVFAQQYTFEDDLALMNEGLELARIEISQNTRDGRTKSGIKTARRVLLAGVSILEFCTKKFNPLNLHLDGFGEYVLGNIEDYDNVFERLLEKYSGKGTMEPELELCVLLGTSAVMFHVSNKFVANAMGGSSGTDRGRQSAADMNDDSRFE